MLDRAKICIVTGSSGFVASNLIPELKKIINVIGIDITNSSYTDYCIDIGDNDLEGILQNYSDHNITIINLAAARFDFGSEPDDYYYKNVQSTELFLKCIDKYNISKFIHMSSVASFDGKHLEYSKKLSCDDAYRVTKNLQENIIINWCTKNNIKHFIIYPSAIFLNKHRSDTNIGKLQNISKYLPFIPNIDVKKSLTFLPFLTNFVIQCINDRLSDGKYLTIERPVKTVTEILRLNIKRKLIVVKIPFLKYILFLISYTLYIFGGFGKIDMKLTPNRVVKIFKNTSYDNIKSIDTHTYNKINSTDIAKIFNNEGE